MTDLSPAAAAVDDWLHKPREEHPRAYRAAWQWWRLAQWWKGFLNSHPRLRLRVRRICRAVAAETTCRVKSLDRLRSE